MSQFVPKHPRVWARQFTDDAVGNEIIAWANDRVTWTRLPGVMALVGVAGEPGRIQYGDWVIRTEAQQMMVLNDAVFRFLFETV